MLGYFLAFQTSLINKTVMKQFNETEKMEKLECQTNVCSQTINKLSKIATYNIYCWSLSVFFFFNPKSINMML